VKSDLKRLKMASTDVPKTAATPSSAENRVLRMDWKTERMDETRSCSADTIPVILVVMKS